MGEITYPVNEIFRSIQGEGFNAGRPAVFIRLAGCNLKCSWCDTNHSVKRRLTYEKLRGELLRLQGPGDIIVLTGGEPTLYPIIPLIQLFGEGRVCIETNGVLWRRLRDIHLACSDVWITVSPKPQRPCYTSFQWANEIKVVFDGSDLPVKVDAHLPARLLNQHRCYIQPCSGKIQPALDFVMGHPWWRLSVQVHKMIGQR